MDMQVLKETYPFTWEALNELSYDNDCEVSPKWEVSSRPRLGLGVLSSLPSRNFPT